MKTNFTKRLLGACRQALMVVAMISALGIVDATAQGPAVVCYVEGNVTMDPDANNCETLVTAASLTSDPDALFFSVTLDGGDNLIPGNPEASILVTAPGTYTYQVEDAGGCWGTFVVEDKSGPICTATPTEDVLFPCGEESDDYFDVITVDDFEDCSDGEITLEVENEWWEDCPASAEAGSSLATTAVELGTVLPTPSPGYEIVSIHRRTWIAKDADNNATSCSQIIFGERPRILVNNLVLNNSTRECGEIVENKTTFYAPGIDVEIELEDGVSNCNYIAFLVDSDTLASCGTDGSKVYKLIRTWNVIDWCAADGEEPTRLTEFIEVEDTGDPTIDKIDEPTFEAEFFDCKGTLNVPAAKGTDSCTQTKWTTTVLVESESSHSGPSSSYTKVISGNGGLVDNISIGSKITISYRLEDECNNFVESKPIVYENLAVDNRPPVAICNDALNVTLINLAAGDQRARIYAKDVDNYSQDNCGIKLLEVKREDGTYGPFVEVNCDDVKPEGITVYLRVTDTNNNTNICWTTIHVEDKTVAKVVPLDPINVTCLNIDDIPAGSDDDVKFTNVGCNPPTAKLNPDPEFSLDCGEATFVRSWIVTPATTNGHEASEQIRVEQVITVTKVESWKITFPDQPGVIDCTVSGDPEILEVKDFLTEDSGCDRWVLSHSIHTFVGSTATCKSVIVKYKLVNECNPYNHFGEPILATSGEMYTSSSPDKRYQGVFHFFQKFDYVDGTPPVVSFVATDTCIISDACNGGQINIENIAVVENCGDAPISAVLLLDAEGKIVSSSATKIDDQTYSFSNLAAGTYTVRVEARDGCGNVGGLTSPAMVVKGDCKKPTPSGAMIAAAVMENCQLDLWMSDLITEVKDNCDLSPESAIELLTDRDASGFFDKADVSSDLFTDPDTDYADYQNVTITATGTNGIALWGRDASGNTQFTIILFDAQDNSPCSPQGGFAASIAGKITNENDEDIDQVMVKFQSSSQSLFEQVFSGNFNYSVPMHTNLTITPEKDLGYMNGVTTADLVKLQRHILGISSLSSAYQMIAADANSDAKVSTKDMLHISRLILGLYDELPNSTSWKFVSKDHQFANPSSPWGFPQAMNYADLDADVQADFVGIKIGDLTGNASPILLLGDDNNFVGEMTIALDETTLTAGQSTVVEFKAADFTDFAGYQFTISLANGVKLTQVTPGVLPNMTEEGNFGLNRLSEGTITTSWSNANGVTLEDGAVLFSLTIESSETMNLSDAISINSKQTAAEAYNHDLDVHTVGVLFKKTDAAEFQLFQNQPNPFNGETMIGFNMPSAGVATLRVMNVAGQVLTTRTAQVVRGYNQISLSKSDLNATGVLYYQIETENHSATKKMVIIE